MEMVNEFFAFMKEREQIRLNREAGLPRAEWTQDEILKKFKFTNVKRSHDRTTRALYAKFYLNHAECSPTEILLNCAIFRYFGTVEMAEDIRWTNFPGDQEMADEMKYHLINTAEDRFRAKKKVFTGAYIIPNCGDSRPKHEVVADIIVGIWKLIPNIIASSYDHPGMDKNWSVMCNLLKEANGVGSFMAKEVVLDFILATGWVPRDWATWTPIGPGARRGAARVVAQGGVLVHPQGMPESSALAVTKALFTEHKKYWPDGWVELSLTDIQFQLCEFDKYMRVTHGDGRPKKMFVPTKD